MDFKTMPKIDLHCHLDGSVRPATLLELGIAAGIHPPGMTLESLLPLAQVPENCTSLKEYLDRFSLPLAVMQTEASLKRISREFMADCEADGLSYVEVRFAPTLHTQTGLTFERVLEAVLEGLKEGSGKTGIPFGVIMCCMRHMTPETTLDHVKRTLPYGSAGVVAVDLAGDEASFPPALHQKAFEAAREAGMHITIHAGETGSSGNIADSIALLYAERIGHGTAAYKDPAVMELLLERQIALEMCPTSNLHTKAVKTLSEHPAIPYLRKGLRVTLNTDNRTVSNITSAEEFEKVNETFALAPEELRQLYENSVRAAFAPEALKDRLLTRWHPL